ncbi:unnamed protein product [Parnassius apollo]|uniref:(apollo) hypothetical protein n=1 Tax=Parnassius apollo TaxID=110799 RepID=A0A8S3WJL1_PARAO|nr:unnamed protein product [Parnassius apollo]
MAHFALLWKARVIEKCRLEYEEEKIHSVLLTNVDIPKRTMMQKWTHYSWNTKQRLIKKIKKLYPEGSSISNFIVYLTTDQTFPNFLMKSVIGFIGGIILTYLCFMFFVFQLSISLIHATIMSSIIGVLLTLGLAFSYRVRCLVFLLVPQFFSRVGRYTLTCYALVLILTGPATNTLKNSEVLSESMACSQEQIKTNVKHIADSINNPFNAMKDWIKVMTERIKGIAKKTKSMLVTTHRMVIGIASVLESSFPWLNLITNKCNEKLGTPFQHCSRLLNKQGIERQCKQHSNSKLPWFCNATYLTNFACRSLKSSRRICEIADYTRSTIVATMRRKFKTFTSRIQSLFYVKIHVHHSYTFSSNASRSASQVAAGIVTEIRNRADPLLTWLSWSSCVTSLAKYYQHMYETRSRFDNRYITKELRNLDFQRLKEGKETVLPLNKREKAKYITTTSFRLLESEKVYLTRSVVFMIITTFKLLIHMVADYSLYWVLMTIRYHGRFQTPLQPGPTDAGLKISGTGPIAELLRSLIGYLTLPLSTPRTSTISCLPNPYPPDLQRYTQIGVLILLMWFFALFEPYGLRLRHVVMGHYRPERATARALWLYNHILRTRGGFMKFARRKLHREYKYLKGDDPTFVQWLDSQLPFWWLRYLLGTLPKDPICLLCEIEEEPNNVVAKLVKCDTPKCPGVYCTKCFNDLGQLCTICLSPVDYGDLSDVSLEKSSSEDSSSDSQDFNEHMESEDDEYSKQIQNFFGKRENTSSRFTFLPKREPDTNNQWKSSKASNNNPRRSFDDSKQSEKSQKEPSKDDTIKKEEPKERSEAGNGDKPSEDKLESRSTCYCMKHIRRLCFCRYADINFGPCSLLRKLFGKSKSSSSNTINHKRRKKDKSDNAIIESKKSPINEKNDDETARIYRISAYIGQQEWMKGELSKSSKTDCKNKKVISTKSINSLHKLKTGSKRIIDTVKQLDQKKETPINTAEVADDDDHNNSNGINGDSQKKQAATTNENTNTISTDYDISKSLRYYCSIGNTEFDQIDDPDQNIKAVVNKDFKINETLLLPGYVGSYPAITFKLFASTYFVESMVA